MSLYFENLEIAERYEEWGIRNTVSGEVLDCESENDAHFQELAYPNAEVVSRQIFVTQWNKPDG